MKITLDDGAVEWTQEYGSYDGGKFQFYGLNPASTEIIFNECFGIDVNDDEDGLVISCGTGIEGCGQFFPM